MEKKDAKSNVKHYLGKLNEVHNLFNSNELSISYDQLSTKDEVEQELLYFKEDGKEKKGIFVFSFPYYIKELEDQEFKKMLGQNSLNFKIMNTYDLLKKESSKKKNSKGVRVNEILSRVSWKDDKLKNNPKILRRVLTLSYYLGWDLKKDKDSFDSDFFIDIKDSSYFNKQKQRFNLDVAIPINETSEYILFINLKGDLNFVFKNKCIFTKQDVENITIKSLKDTFKIKTINLE
jgi:hypothetical protein